MRGRAAGRRRTRHCRCRGGGRTPSAPPRGCPPSSRTPARRRPPGRPSAGPPGTATAGPADAGCSPHILRSDASTSASKSEPSPPGAPSPRPSPRRRPSPPWRGPAASRCESSGSSRRARRGARRTSRRRGWVEPRTMLQPASVHFPAFLHSAPAASIRVPSANVTGSAPSSSVPLTRRRALAIVRRCGPDARATPTEAAAEAGAPFLAKKPPYMATGSGRCGRRRKRRPPARRRRGPSSRTWPTWPPTTCRTT